VGSVLQLVDPDTVSQKQYLDFCLAALGDRIRVRYAPMSLMYTAASGLELAGRLLRRGVPLTRYRLRSIKGIRHFNCSAARERLGWQPRIGVRAGLEKTFGPRHSKVEDNEIRVGTP
jgi:nucleoside-diphosphate-sugar epimerase